MWKQQTCLHRHSDKCLILLFYSSGSGPNRGHYITIVKSHGFWLLFDDDIVEVGMLLYAENKCRQHHSSAL